MPCTAETETRWSRATRPRQVRVRFQPQKGFDVAAFELGERGDVGELVGEELAEEDEVVDQPVH